MNRRRQASSRRRAPSAGAGGTPATGPVLVGAPGRPRNAKAPSDAALPGKSTVLNGRKRMRSDTADSSTVIVAAAAIEEKRDQTGNSTSEESDRFGDIATRSVKRSAVGARHPPAAVTRNAMAEVSCLSDCLQERVVLRRRASDGAGARLLLAPSSARSGRRATSAAAAVAGAVRGSRRRSKSHQCESSSVPENLAAQYISSRPQRDEQDRRNCTRHDDENDDLPQVVASSDSNGLPVRTEKLPPPQKKKDSRGVVTRAEQQVAVTAKQPSVESHAAPGDGVLRHVRASRRFAQWETNNKPPLQDCDPASPEMPSADAPFDSRPKPQLPHCNTTRQPKRDRGSYYRPTVPGQTNGLMSENRQGVARNFGDAGDSAKPEGGHLLESAGRGVSAGLLRSSSREQGTRAETSCLPLEVTGSDEGISEDGSRPMGAPLLSAVATVERSTTVQPVPRLVPEVSQSSNKSGEPDAPLLGRHETVVSAADVDLFASPVRQNPPRLLTTAVAACRTGSVLVVLSSEARQSSAVAELRASTVTADHDDVHQARPSKWASSHQAAEALIPQENNGSQTEEESNEQKQRKKDPQLASLVGSSGDNRRDNRAESSLTGKPPGLQVDSSTSDAAAPAAGESLDLPSKSYCDLARVAIDSKRLGTRRRESLDSVTRSSVGDEAQTVVPPMRDTGAPTSVNRSAASLAPNGDYVQENRRRRRARSVSSLSGPRLEEGPVTSFGLLDVDPRVTTGDLVGCAVADRRGAARKHVRSLNRVPNPLVEKNHQDKSSVDEVLRHGGGTHQGCNPLAQELHVPKMDDNSSDGQPNALTEAQQKRPSAATASRLRRSSVPVTAPGNHSDQKNGTKGSRASCGEQPQGQCRCYGCRFLSGRKPPNLGGGVALSGAARDYSRASVQQFEEVTLGDRGSAISEFNTGRLRVDLQHQKVGSSKRSCSMLPAAFGPRGSRRRSAPPRETHLSVFRADLLCEAAKRAILSSSSGAATRLDCRRVELRGEPNAKRTNGETWGASVSAADKSCNGVAGALAQALGAGYAGGDVTAPTRSAPFRDVELARSRASVPADCAATSTSEVRVLPPMTKAISTNVADSVDPAFAPDGGPFLQDIRTKPSGNDNATVGCGEDKQASVVDSCHEKNYEYDDEEAASFWNLSAEGDHLNNIDAPSTQPAQPFCLSNVVRAVRCNYIDQFLHKMIADAAAVVGTPNYFAYFKECKYGRRVCPLARRALIEFMLEIGRGVQAPISDFSLHMAVNLFDRFMSIVGAGNDAELREKTAEELEIVGVACLYMCSKLEDNWPLCLSDLCKTFDSGLERKRRSVLTWELQISRMFNFVLCSPTVLDFLHELLDRSATYLTRQFESTPSRGRGDAIEMLRRIEIAAAWVGEAIIVHHTAIGLPTHLIAAAAIIVASSSVLMIPPVAPPAILRLLGEESAQLPAVASIMSLILAEDSERTASSDSTLTVVSTVPRSTRKRLAAAAVAAPAALQQQQQKGQFRQQ